MTEIDPGYIADPENAAALRERANNTSNVNQAPTTKVPIKSQALDGPTPDARAKALDDADQATVDPSPHLNGTVEADHAATAEAKPKGSTRSK